MDTGHRDWVASGDARGRPEAIRREHPGIKAMVLPEIHLGEATHAGTLPWCPRLAPWLLIHTDMRPALSFILENRFEEGHRR